MDELAGEQTPWDLDKHLSGCLAGHQTDQSYGAAVYFALEALSGIAHDVAVRANEQCGKVIRKYPLARLIDNKLETGEYLPQVFFIETQERR